ncbi:hypothetical protein M5K25_004476 [Dendrobium thyrsiflorum]|uniref:Transmembrane protein n=1 Tax=Dendrobium thyrsiflorum TaxID=117978 RepID=A0ABD0VMV9_DENTH
MDSNSFHFFKHPSVVASISLLLLILILLTTCSWCFFSSTPLTMLYLLLSCSFSFIFSKLKQKVKPSQESPQQEKRTDIKVASFEEIISDELIDSDQKLMLGSDCSVFEDSNLFGSSQSSEHSISDDESLIEIALPDGRYIDFGKTSSESEHELLLDYLPKSLFLQHGLMELLLEINEEDNMIEIDIAMGSIKCPRFQIKD